MPTGYTASIQDGAITEFPEFALQCARAFGALVMMRDEPASAPIPDEFQPSDYHIKAMDGAKAKLLSLEQMTESGCSNAAKEEYEKSLESIAEREAKRLEQKRRYTAMRAKVEAWTPPTPDHTGLRDFMLEQIDSSINFDCRDYGTELPDLQTGPEWLAIEKARAERDIAYHTKKNAEELERTATRNAWVKALRESLSAP